MIAVFYWADGTREERSIDVPAPTYIIPKRVPSIRTAADFGTFDVQRILRGEPDPKDLADIHHHRFWRTTERETPFQFVVYREQ